MGTLLLFLNLEKVLQFITVENNVCCGFVIYGLYYVEVCSFSAYFLESFCHKWVLNFVKCFLCICWDDHMIFIFNLLIWCIIVINLCKLNNPYIPGIKPAWWWYMMFLTCCWILFAGSLLRIFRSSVILTSNFPFCDIFVWFWYQSDGGHIEWVWELSFHCSFLKEFEWDRY